MESSILFFRRARLNTSEWKCVCICSRNLNDVIIVRNTKTSLIIEIAFNGSSNYIVAMHH